MHTLLSSVAESRADSTESTPSTVYRKWPCTHKVNTVKLSPARAAKQPVEGGGVSDEREKGGREGKRKKNGKNKSLAEDRERGGEGGQLP